MVQEAVILTKLKKSEKFYNSASMLYANRYYNSAANRYYYSLFQLVYAWALLEDDISESATGKHSLLKRFLRQKQGDDHRINDKIVRTFDGIRGLRETGDYGRENIGSGDIDRINNYNTTRSTLNDILEEKRK
jgi:uncharacterized protein (UPF0332 family)